MNTIKRDPDTGQVQAINGNMGKVLAWLKVFQPLALFVMGAILIPLAVIHYSEHEQFRHFMAKGDRVVPADVEAAVKDLKADLVSVGVLPIADQRLATLERDMEEVKQTQKELRSLVVANGTNIDAILRILKD